MKNQKIFVFGNEIVPKDKNPVIMLPILKANFPETTFIHVDPTDNWIENIDNPTIIDTVSGLEKPYLFNSLDSFQKSIPRFSPHDYDLYLDLAIMIKLEKISRFRIIGVPQLKLTKTIIREVISIIKQVFQSKV